MLWFFMFDKVSFPPLLWLWIYILRQQSVSVVIRDNGDWYTTCIKFWHQPPDLWSVDTVDPFILWSDSPIYLLVTFSSLLYYIHRNFTNYRYFCSCLNPCSGLFDEEVSFHQSFVVVDRCPDSWDSGSVSVFIFATKLSGIGKLLILSLVLTAGPWARGTND